MNLNEFFQKTLSENNLSNNNCINLPISRVIIIDSTWNQSKAIFKDSRLQGNFIVFKKKLTIRK